MKISESRILPRLFDAFESGTVTFTEWEQTFLDDMQHKPENTEITDRQMAAILKMSNKLPEY